MPTYEVTYSIRGSITVNADSEQEAMKTFLNPDETPTEDLIKCLENNIADLGNDAITIDDLWKEGE